MEYRSLLLSKDLSKQRAQYKDALRKLEEIMLERASRNLQALPELRPDTGDSINRSYNEEFQKKNEKSALGRVGNDGWKLWDSQSGISDEILVPDTAESRVHVGSSRSVRCRLWQRSHGDCVAIPSDRQEQKFTIKADKRRCAFEGACVEVEEIQKNPESGERFGRVCSILEQGSIQPVLCQVDRNNELAFDPVDGKSPMFLNVPHITQTGSGEMSEKDFDEHLSKPKRYISCFDSKFLKKGCTPKIIDSIPLEVVHNLLFVVQPIFWFPKYCNPIGAVIGTFPKGTSIGHAMKILSIQYQVPDRVTDAVSESDVPMATSDIKMPLDSKLIIGIEGLNKYCQIAFSVEEKPDNLREINIYLPDITDHMQRIDDQNTGHRTSFLGECKGNNVYHPVLPTQTLKLASINSTHPVKCFCLQLVVPVTCTESHVNVKEAELQSESFAVAKLIITFHDLETILQGTSRGKPLTKALSAQLGKHDEDSLTSAKKLHYLFRVAERLHFQRKGHSGYSNMKPHSYSYPDAWKLVNEMLILVNSTAAKRIAKTFPQRTLLKVQPPLSEHSKGEIVRSFSGLLQFTTQYRCLEIDKQSEAGVTQIPLLPAVCSKLLTALGDSPSNFMLAKQLLSLPVNHAHLLVLDAVMSDHVPKEEYAVKRIAKKGKDVDAKVALLDQPAKCPHLAHYSQEVVCSPITDPFDSVIDIYTQRLLKLSIEGSVQDLSRQDFAEITRQCNMSTLNANNYSTALTSLNLAISAQHSSVCVDAVIKGLSDEDIHFSYYHPSLSMPSLSTIAISLLSGSSRINYVSFSMKMASVICPLRIITSPRYKTEDTSDKTKEKNELLVYNCSSSAGNFKEHRYFITYVPRHAYITQKEWKLEQEIIDHSDGESAKKLQSFLNDFLKFHESYQFQPLSRSHEQADLEATEDQKHLWKHTKKKTKDLEPWEMEDVPFVILKTHFQFAQLQTFKMWLRADTNEYVATPKPQLLELSPDVRLCIQHVEEPEYCFTSGVVAEPAKVMYSSMRQYCRIWEDILLSEAAVSSVRQNHSQIFLFSDFLLNFSGFEVPQDCIGEEFYEPSGEITAILTKEFLQSRQDIFLFEPGYFVCARYEIDLEKEQGFAQNYSDCLHPAATDKCARIVLHMVVDSVTPIKKEALEVETDMVTTDAEEYLPEHCDVKVRIFLFLQLIVTWNAIHFYSFLYLRTTR